MSNAGRDGFDLGLSCLEMSMLALESRQSTEDMKIGKLSKTRSVINSSSRRYNLDS